MERDLAGRESKANMMEKAVGRMMGGSTSSTAQEQRVDIVIGQEYGRTPYSGEPEKIYEATRGNSRVLHAPEYYALTQGYWREWVCMGQCNLFMQALKNPMIRQSMLTYRQDVCSPNLAEMHEPLRQRGYEPPAPFNGARDAKSLDELPQIDTAAIDDQMILIGHIFTVEGFMNLWNKLGTMTHDADLRDAFLRNYHRANRWHLATLAIAKKMQFLEEYPEIRAH